MALFQYRALQLNGGGVTEGQLEAGGRQEAFRQMEALGLKPISLAEKAGAAAEKAAASGPAKKALSFQSNKVTARELENFTRLLSSLLASGVPLSRALVILYKEASSPAASAKWKEVHDAVIDGVSLAEAMSRSPDTFPKIYVAMVEAGETGGFLDVVLAQIADFQAREKEMRSKVMAAMLYPLVLFCLATAVLIFLMVFFIPKFQKMFDSFPGAQLPLITRIIIAISHGLVHYGLWIAAGVLIVGYLVRTWVVSEAGRRVWEGFILRIAVIGRLTGQFAMARFCRMLGTLLEAQFARSAQRP